MNVSALSIRALFTALVVALTTVTVPIFADAQTSECTFTRTLSLGDTGEDVLCLQKYLNTTSHKVAEAGVGSPGKETTQYGSLTEKAVLAWQKANGVAGANGNFGPGSQAKYKSLLAAGPSAPVASAPQSEAERLLSLIDSLQAEIDQERGVATPQVAGASTDSESDAEKTLKTVFTLLFETQTKIAKEKDEDDREDLYRDHLQHTEDLIAALFAYFEGRNDVAIRQAEVVQTSLNKSESSNRTSSRVNNSDAEAYVEDVWDDYDDAKDEVDEVEEDGDDVEDAVAALKKAKKKLKQADIAVDEEEWGDAIEYAEEAEELIDEALDEIGKSSRDDDEEDEAEDALNDIRDELDDAWDEVEEASDDGKSTRRAEKYLDEAEELYDEAKDAFDDEDWDEVFDLIEEIEDLIDDALDEL